ncbi:MAG: hypothetical protein HQL74_12285 [Magnetococcales bacterium]|nr:hypothetical protein [Magnetococcales bacterium]
MHPTLSDQHPDTSRQESRFLVATLLMATALFVLYSVGFSITPGRCFTSYLEHYYGYLTFDTFARSVGSSYLLGWISQLSMSWIHVVFCLMYLAHLLTVYYTARLFGRLTARIVMILMIFHVGVLNFFHQMGHAALLCLALSTWSAILVQFFRTRKHVTLFLLGLLTGSLMLIRQTSILFLLTAVFPVVCFGSTALNWMRSAVIGLGFLVALFALLFYNYFTFNVFKLSSSIGLQVPTIHVAFFGPGFSTDYGPKNQELLKLMDARLGNEDYKNKKITIDQFNNNTLKNMQQYTDLVMLNHEHPGVLTGAIYESILARPVIFIKSLLTMTWRMFTINPPLWPPSPNPEQKRTPQARQNDTADYVVLDKTNLSKIMIDNEFKQTLKIPDELDPTRARINLIVDRFKQNGNYYASFVFTSFLKDVLPPMLVFLLASFLLIFKINALEVKLLLTILIPTLMIIFGSGLIGQQLTDLRLPLDFLVILGGVAGVLPVRATLGTETA